MSDTTTSPVETTETAPETAAPQDTLTQLRSELRDAGEAGKKQWQEAFARTREALTSTRSELGRAAARTREVAAATWSRAEARGADLLLRLVSQARAATESVEASLRSRAGETPGREASTGEAQPATA